MNQHWGGHNMACAATNVTSIVVVKTNGKLPVFNKSFNSLFSLVFNIRASENTSYLMENSVK